jgi:hypothetical protein
MYIVLSNDGAVVEDASRARPGEPVAIPHCFGPLRRDREAHEHASERAGDASSITIDARITVMIYTRDHQSALLFVHFLTPAHPAELWQP